MSAGVPPFIVLWLLIFELSASLLMGTLSVSYSCPPMAFQGLGTGSTSKSCSPGLCRSSSIPHPSSSPPCTSLLLSAHPVNPTHFGRKRIWEKYMKCSYYKEPCFWNGWGDKAFTCWGIQALNLCFRVQWAQEQPGSGRTKKERDSGAERGRCHHRTGGDAG